MDILEIMKPIGFPPQSRDQAIKKSAGNFESLGYEILLHWGKRLSESEGKSLIMIMWILLEARKETTEVSSREARGTSLVVSS